MFGDASDFEDPSLSSHEDNQQADPQGRHAFRFNMRMLLGLQTLFCVALVFLLGPYPGLLVAVVAIGGTFALIIIGTVQIASDPGSAPSLEVRIAGFLVVCVGLWLVSTDSGA